MARKFTNLEKYAIQGMMQSGLNSVQIAKETGYAVTDIDTYMTELNVSLEKVSKIKKEKKKPKGEAPKKINSNDVISKTTATGGKLHGAMMNRAASERGDDFRQTIKPRNWDEKIHVINPEKK